MNAAQTTAVRALLATMSVAQRAALLDVLGMHIENVETSDDVSDGDTTALETEGHAFLEGLRDAIAETTMTYAERMDLFADADLEVEAMFPTPALTDRRTSDARIARTSGAGEPC